MKLWQKDIAVQADVERFTVGRDREMDLLLAEWDVVGSLAHTQMLESIGLLEKSELVEIHKALKIIYKNIQKNNFTIEAGVEDVHSQVEFLLTKMLGEAGKKIHSARSRNDQVLTDIKLYLRSELQYIVSDTQTLFDTLITLSETHKNTLLPGYTHLQIAMPSSFGLWFGAYSESLADDLEVILAAYRIVNKNPLGSAAGYGSSFPINRQMTTDLMGFETMNANVVYAQMTRGKSEKIVATAIAAVAATLARLAMDVCLYMSQNFAFVSFPDELTTGSSIMPHKKNPDVFELIRAKCNRLQALPNEFAMFMTNLPSGYHRDMQLTKEMLFPAIADIKDCLKMTTFMLRQIKVRENIVQEEKYAYLFTVEAVNALVLEGTPFRDAYKKVGKDIGEGNFHPNYKVQHTHEGSIGNLQNELIQARFEGTLKHFAFQKVEKAIKKLVR
jgi:argininosuccinate lyase